MSLEHVDTLISFALVMLLISLLVTVLVEACNVLLMRRGRNLRWGVKQVLVQMGVSERDAKRLAKAVLRHPALSPSGKVYASAIRPEELARVAAALLEDRRVVLEDRVAAKLRNAAAGMGALGGATLAAHRAEALAALGDELASIAREELERAGHALNPDELRSRVANTMRAHVDAAARAGAEAAAELSAWFHTVMDRTTERFVSRTRVTTVAIALALCAGFHVDSLSLMERLSTEPALRASLVEASGAALGDAARIQEEMDTGRAIASEALAAVRGQLDADPTTQPLARFLDAVPADLRTPRQAEDWLSAHVADAADRGRILELFEDQNRRRLDERLARVREVGLELADKLEATKLDLFAEAARRGLDWSDPATGRIDWKHLCGVAVSVLLLSLGAPFWFNVLRNLSNLRPIVARRVETEARAAPAAPSQESGS